MSKNWHSANIYQRNDCFFRVASGIFGKEVPVFTIDDSEVLILDPSLVFLGMPSITPLPEIIPDSGVNVAKDFRANGTSVVLRPAIYDWIYFANDMLG